MCEAALKYATTKLNCLEQLASCWTEWRDFDVSLYSHHLTSKSTVAVQYTISKSITNSKILSGQALSSIVHKYQSLACGNRLTLAKSQTQNVFHMSTISQPKTTGLFNQQTLLLTENCLQYRKRFPYKGRGVVSIPICANKVRNGPASVDQGLSTASQDSCNVHGISQICLLTFPYPTLFASAKPIFKNWLRQLITCSQSQMTPYGITGG